LSELALPTLNVTALAASSIASLLLTTEALIRDIPEEKKDAPAGMPGGGGMGGMY
jgi:chaperonin GroEL